MRLFTAITFSAACLQGLHRSMAGLFAAGVRGRYTSYENLHLTLTFLGECADDAAVRRALDALSAAPFTFTLQGAGSFSRGEKHLLWAGVKATPQLMALQKQQADLLAAAGFAIEPRPYRPHITLVRDAVLPEGFDLRAFGAAQPVLPVTVTQLTLMESCREQGRLVYRPRWHKQLG